MATEAVVTDTQGAASAGVNGVAAAQDAGGLVFHPLEQFIVKPLFGEGPIHWYTPTNVTLWMALAVLCVVALFVLGSRGRAIVPTRTQSIGELIYGFTYKMVEDVTGKDGIKYFPYVMTIFVFILFVLCCVFGWT